MLIVKYLMLQDKGSFWWHNVMKYCDLFRGVTTCKIENGTTVLFWNDSVIQDRFCRLYTYARNKSISVAKFLSEDNMLCHFHLPLSVQAYQELMQLQELIQQLQLPQDTDKDSWQLPMGKCNIHLAKAISLCLQKL
jgi:hypothetical protein